MKISISFFVLVCIAYCAIQAQAGYDTDKPSSQPDPRFPYVGFYEAHATYLDKSYSPPEMVEAATELKWFRLFENCVYRTNKIGGKQRSGHFTYDSDRKRIVFTDGWMRSYLEYRGAGFTAGSPERPRPSIGWDGPGDCLTHCDWIRR